jgi:hypothetical protein
MTKKIQLAQQLLNTYDSLLIVQQKIDEKLSNLLKSQPFYDLFEHDKSHPYFELQNKSSELIDTFERLLYLIADIKAARSIIKDDVAQIVQNQKHSGRTMCLGIDVIIARYSSSIKKITAKNVALQYVELFRQASWLWSNCDKKSVENKLLNVNSNKSFKKHLEVPFIDVVPDAKSLLKEIKKIGSLILKVEIETSNVRNELEKQRTFLALSNQLSDNVIDVVLLLK